MKQVTDTALLSQLEAGPRPVTDPDLLEQLDAPAPSFSEEAKQAPLAPAAVGETLLQMGSGFAGALPGAAAGLYSAATGGEFAPAFKSVQDFYTYEPRTKYGKDLSQRLGDLMQKYSHLVDVVADKTPGGPLAQTAVKTVGEAIPLVAPFAPRAVRGVRESMRPVADQATIDALNRAEPTTRQEAPAAEQAMPVQEATAEATQAQARPVTDPAIVDALNKAPDDLSLEQPTQEGLAAKDRAIAERQAAEQQAQAAAEQKAQADAEAKDFNLTGSDRVADANPAQADIFTYTERGPRKPPQVDETRDSITTAVSKLGGLETSYAQDIAAVGAKATRDVGGFNYVIRKGGRTADDMAEALHERGYLGSRDINEMFDKLDAELRAGEPKHFSTRQDIDRYMQEQAERSGIQFDALDEGKIRRLKSGAVEGVLGNATLKTGAKISIEASKEGPPRTPDQLEVSNINHPPNSGDFTIRARDANGKVIGHLELSRPGNSMTVEPRDVRVDAAYRRQGVATALYQAASHLGFNVKRSLLQTPEGAALRRGMAFRSLDVGYIEKLLTRADRPAFPETPRVSPLVELRSGFKRLESGKLTEPAFISEVEGLLRQLEGRRGVQLERAALRERARGTDYVEERLLRAKRNGELTAEQVEMGRWLLRENPALAEDLGVSVRQRPQGSGASGQYNPVARIASLFTDTTKPDVAVHEILHHSERMMPEEVQAGIYKEWSKRFSGEVAKAKKEGNSERVKSLETMLEAYAGDQGAANKLAGMFKSGKLPYEDYQLTNPSEFWAVNATRIMGGRYNAAGWVAKAKQWFAEFLQKAKGLLRLNSDSPVLRGLESVLRSEGEFRSKEMLASDVRRFSDLDEPKESNPIDYANRKLSNALGKPQEGVSVLSAGRGAKGSVLDAMRSPSELIKKYPELKPFKDRADRAQVEMDTLRDVFGRRLSHVDRLLGGGVQKVKDLGKQYRANKTLLNEVLIEGDFLGKRFTSADMKEMFNAPDNVIRAYELLRAAYDHALTLANQTRELRGKSEVTKREGYVPHFFHDFFIISGDKILASARTLREAVAMANEAASNGAQVKVVPKQMRFPGEEVQAAVIGDNQYFKLQQGLEDAFSMTAEEAKGLLDDVAKMRGRSRYVGNFMERKGASGWEQNLDWAHRHYFNMVSRYVALDKFKSNTISHFERRFGPFDKEYRGIKGYIKDYINDINGVPTRSEELMDATLSSIPGMQQFMEAYLGQRPSLQIAQVTTNAVAIAKLGLYNVSAALVNGSQALMSQALLTPEWFARGAARAARVTAELTRRRVGVDGTTNPDIGILRQLDVPIQQGLESGAGYTAIGTTGRLFKASTAFFRGVEFELRATAALGAYYKGLSEGMPKESALKYARDINRRVNFDYSQADTPSFIRRSGPVGQVVFQFKKFPIKTMEYMVNLKGAEKPRFWIPFVLISGYYAFPGMEALKNAVKSVFGIDIELEAKDYLIRWAGDDDGKKAIAKTIMYGAFSNDSLGGVDISRRVGGGDFIPSEVKDLFGPFFSSTIRATQMAASQHWPEALREIATAPGNIAITLKNDGELTNPWNRDRLKTQLDTSGMVKKSLGFTTVKESQERDTVRVMRYNEQQQREEERKAIDLYIRGFRASNQGAIDRAITRFAELGMGEGTGARIKEEMAKKGMTASEREFNNLSKKGKAREIPLTEFAR